MIFLEWERDTKALFCCEALCVTKALSPYPAPQPQRRDAKEEASPCSGHAEALGGRVSLPELPSLSSQECFASGRRETFVKEGIFCF